MCRMMVVSPLVLLSLMPLAASSQLNGEALIVLPPDAPQAEKIVEAWHARWKNAMRAAENDESRAPYLGILALMKDSGPQIEVWKDWRDKLTRPAVVLELEDLQVSSIARSGRLPVPAEMSRFADIQFGEARLGNVMTHKSVVPAGTEVEWKDWRTRVRYSLWHCPGAGRARKIVAGTINASSSEKAGDPAFGSMTITKRSELEELLAAVDHIDRDVRQKLARKIVVGKYLPAQQVGAVPFGKYYPAGFAPRKVDVQGDQLVFSFELRNSLPVRVRGTLSVGAGSRNGEEQDGTAPFDLMPEEQHELRVSIPRPRVYGVDPRKTTRGEIVELQLLATEQ